MRRAGFICAAVLGFGACAQSGLSVFRPDTVHEIRITTDRPDWFQAMVDWHDLQQDSAQLVRMSFDGQELDSVGMHMRGNFSFSTATYKKPFKLDMNAFVGGQEFDGLRSLCLNNDIIDRSHLHTTLAYRLLNDFGVEAPRTGFANLYINDELYGLYTLVEQVNKAYTGERFGNNDGDLWKSYMCFWDYLGPDTAAYAGQMQLKEAYDSTAYSRLIHVFELLATTPDEALADTLAAVLDLESFLRTWAVNAATDSEDNGPHNWWLYWNPDSARYSCIPWDYDLAFYNVTAAAFSEDTTGFYWWASTRLTKAVTRSPVLMARYYQLLCEFHTELFHGGQLTDRIDSAHALLRPFVLNDNTLDNCPVGVFDAAYYALNPQQQISQWGLHAFIAEQGTLVDSTLLAHGVHCFPTALDEPDTTNELQVYPNPGDGIFHVVCAGAQGGELLVRDGLGRSVRTAVMPASGTLTVDLTDRPPGLYYLIQKGSRGATGKLMVVR